MNAIRNICGPAATGVLLAITLIPNARAALPGAWESFPTQVNADAWLVYDYEEGSFFLPEWENSAGSGLYIWSWHAGDSPLGFFADNKPGDGAFTGDYAAANARAVSCDIYIEDLDEFEKLDCAVYATGPAGRRFYYSAEYFYDDFDDDGWWNVEFSFSRPWYYWDENEWVAVTMTEELLGTVESIEFTFYPRLGTTSNALAAIDDVRLEPLVEAPPLATGTNTAGFHLSFGKAAGVSYAIERMETDPPFSWSTVPGQTGINGPGSHLFTTPLDERTKLFRVTADPLHTPVVTE